MTKKKLTPYQRIVRAAKKGVGIRLTWKECFDLSRDDAISHRAETDDAADNGDHAAEDYR